MSTPLRITYRNMHATAALDAAVRERLAWLEQHHPRLISCHVVVEAPVHAHHRQGPQYEVHVELGLKGGEVSAAAKPTAHEDCYLAIRDAFRAARRQVEELVERQRLHVKRHSLPDLHPGRDR